MDFFVDIENLLKKRFFSEREREKRERERETERDAGARRGVRAATRHNTAPESLSPSLSLGDRRSYPEEKK